MTRFRLFAKGNSDVADALFGCSDQRGQWGGLNQHFRETDQPHRMRLMHETATRSDALLAAGGVVPDALSGIELAWPYGAESQFSTLVFDEEVDAVALSLQGDINVKLMRHRSSGAMFYPGAITRPDSDVKAWLRKECQPLPPLPVDQAMAFLASVIDRIRARHPQVAVLVFNLSEFVPGDETFSQFGVEESLALRIKRFNLAAMELTKQPGVGIVDVNRIVAEHGARTLKLDAVRVNSIGSRLIAIEAARVLAQLGIIGSADTRL